MRIQSKESKEFTPCPEYTGQGVCVDVTEPKRVTTKYGERDLFRIVFETTLPREDGTRYCVWSQGFTPSTHEKAGLRKFLRGWFGRDLTAEELASFDTESLVGKPAFLVVVHNDDGTTTYANIASCTPDKSATPLAPSGKFIRQRDREGKGDDKLRLPKDPPKPAAAPAPAPAQAAVPAPVSAPAMHGQVVVHVGRCRGMQLSDLSADQVAALAEKWVPLAKANPNPSNDDLVLIAALESLDADMPF